MEVIRLNSKWEKGHFIRMTPDEALRLISSLSIQILEKNPNSQREEFWTDKGQYFSIAVHSK